MTAVTLQQALNPAVHTVVAATPLAEVWRRMEQSGIRRLVVLDGAGAMVGLLTRHDVVKALQAHHVDIPRDAHDVEIAATIIAMAKNLKLQVLAENVETEEQPTFPQTHDCDAYQGYFHSRPLPARVFLDLSRKRQVAARRTTRELPV